MTCPVGRPYNPDHPTCRSCERQGEICRGILQKRSKYNAKRVTVDGITFDSKKEAVRWQELRMMERAGAITDLQRQVAFELQPATVMDGRKKPALRYVADAVYQQDGRQIVEDVKSPVTRKKETYRIKRHLMLTVLGIEIREV